MPPPLLDEGEDVTELFRQPSADEGEDVTAMFSVPSMNDGEDVTSKFASKPPVAPTSSVLANMGRSVLGGVAGGVADIVGGAAGVLAAPGRSSAEDIAEFEAKAAALSSKPSVFKDFTESQIAGMQTAPEGYRTPQEEVQLASYDSTLKTLRERQAKNAPIQQGLEDFQKLSSEASKEAQTFFGQDPARQDEFLSKLATGAGSLPPYIASSIAGGPVASMMIGALQTGQNEYNAAIEAGKPELADEAMVKGMGIGLTEGAGVGGGLGKAAQGFAAKAWVTLKKAFEEGGQEWVQNTLSNLNASTFTDYDPTRPALKGSGEAFAIGAILGGGVEGVGQAIRKDPVLAAAAPATAAAVARTQPVTVTVPEVTTPTLPSGSLGPPDPIVAKVEAAGAQQTAAALNQTMPPKPFAPRIEEPGTPTPYGRETDVFDITTGLQRKPAPAAPEPAPVAEVPGAKEPWQMTKAEAAEDIRKTHQAAMVKAQQTGEPWDRSWRGQGGRAWGWLTEPHEQAIRIALREGKPVPESVLADYPDLKPTPAAPAAKVVETDAEKAIRRRKFSTPKELERGDAAALQDKDAYVASVVARLKERGADKLETQTWKNEANTSHRHHVEIAIAGNKPVSAAAVESYGIKLPEGWTQRGDLWHPPEAKPAPAAPEPAPVAASQPSRVQLRSGPATYFVVEQLAPQKGDQPGEVYFRVKNERTGEEQTVEAADMKPVKAKAGAVPVTQPAPVVLPTKPTSPQTKAAVAKVAAKLKTTGKTKLSDAKAIKAELVAQIESLLAKATSQESSEAKRIRQELAEAIKRKSTKRFIETLQAQLANEVNTRERVIIRSPKAGTFSITTQNDAVSLQDILDRISGMEVDPKPYPQPKGPSGGGSTEAKLQAEQLVDLIGTEEAIAEMLRQKAQVKGVAAQKMFNDTISEIQKLPKNEGKAVGMKRKLRGSESGAIPASLFADIADFGARIYREGMDFAAWAKQMVRHLGGRVRSALKELWVGILNPKGARNLRGEVIQKRDQGGAIGAAGGRAEPKPGAPVEGGRAGVEIKEGEFAETANDLFRFTTGPVSEVLRGLSERFPKIADALKAIPVERTSSPFFDGRRIGLGTTTDLNRTIMHEQTHAVLDIAIDEIPSFKTEIDAISNDVAAEIYAGGNRAVGAILSLARSNYKTFGAKKNLSFSAYFAANRGFIERAYNQGTVRFPATEADWRNAYALSGPHEFLAALMSDENFRNILQSAEIKGPKKSVWKRFIEAIKKLFGKAISSGDTTLLNRAMETIESLMQNPDYNPRPYDRTYGRSEDVPKPGAKVEGGREGEYYTRVAERDKGTLSDNAWNVVRNRTTLPDSFKEDVDEAAKILLQTNDGDLRSALDRSKEMSASGLKDYFSGLTDRRKAALLFLIAQNAATQRETATDPKQNRALMDVEAEAIADFTDLMSQGGKLLNIAGQLYAAMPMSPDAQVMAAEKLLARMTGGKAAEAEAQNFLASLSTAMRKELAEAMLGQPWSVVNQLEMVRVIAKLAAEGYAGKLNFEFKVTPPSKGTRQIVLPGLAGMRESLASMLAKGLERNWWQALAGPRAPVGPLTAGVNSTQNQLAGILRQVMEARKLVNKEQAAKLTDAEKVAMFIGKKQLTEEAVAKLDESVSEEIEKRATEAIEAADDANKPAVKAQWAAIRDAWEEATSSMKNRPASNATMRRMIHAEAKESEVDWDAEMDAANDSALAQRLAAALVERVKAETSGEKLPGFPALDLETLRAAALEQAQTVVAAKRIKYTERMIARAQAEFNKALVSAEYAKQAPQREAEAIIRAHSPIIAKLNLPDAVRKAVRALFTEQFRANPERDQATFERDMTALGVPAEAATRLYQIANTSRGIREAAQKLAQYKRATGKGAQRQAMSDEMKAAEESIRNILMNKGRQTWDQVRDNLINGALNRMPFATTADRDVAADAMIADFKARMEKAKASALKALDRGTPKERQKAKTINEKLFKLFELGALDDAAASRVFMEKAGVQEFTPAFRDKLRKMYEDAETAPEGMPRERILGNIAVELALANPKTFGFWWNLAMSISYGNILGAFTTIFVNNPLGSAATSGEMTLMSALSNKGARRETLKGAVKTWARSLGDGVAMMRDLWSTGENLQKITQFDSALVNSPVELLAKMAEDPAFPKKFRGAAKAVSQYKWIMRAMMAADAVIRWPAREAARFTQAAALAKETRKPGQSLEDAVDELNYPGGRLAAVKEARAQAAQERKDGTLKTKLDERLRVIQLLQSKLLSEAGTEAATESDELANYGSLLNDQPQDFIGVIASAILKIAFPSNTKTDIQKALGGAAQPFVRFVRTSANATRVMLDYSIGYGAFRYMTRNWPVIGAESLAGGANLVEGRAGDRLTQVRIQRAYLGIALYAGLAAIYAAIDDDDEDPYIDFIGSGPTTPDERRRVRESGVRFNSIKIGDNYFPTNVGMLQPLAGNIAPFQRMRDNKKWPKGTSDIVGEKVPELAGVAVAKGIADAVMNQSFTRSLADLLTIINTGKTSFGEDKWEFAGKNLAQFIPGNLRGLSQLDEIVRGKKERADGFFDTATNAIAFYAPNGRATTILGDEVDAGKSVAQKAGEKVFQFTTLADDKTLQFVVKNGLSIPDRQPKPSDGKRQTYPEYSEYMRESGKMMRNWLETKNPETGKTGMEMLQSIPDEAPGKNGKPTNPRKKAMNELWVKFRRVALMKQ